MRTASLLIFLAGCAAEWRPSGELDAGGSADATSPAAADGAPAAPDAPWLPLPALDFDDYHSQADIAAWLRAVADARPGLARFEVLGASQEGREIAVLVIDATGRAGAPAVLALGTHHGNEKSSTEAPLALADHLLRHPDDPAVRDILDQYVVYVLPLLNPDGHAADTREDAQGRDPNRDYAYPERSEADSFDQPETGLVRDLHAAAPFRGALAYHSGIEEIIWPWAYTGDASPHADQLATLAHAGCDAMGFDRCLQSYWDYPTEGEYIDFAYWKHGTLAFTVEVSTDPTPSASQLATVVARSVDGSMAVLTALHALDQGTMMAVPAGPPRHGTARPRIVDGERQE